MNVEEGSSGLARLVAAVLRFRVIALFLFLGVTGILCFQIRNLDMSANPVASMIPPGNKLAPVIKAVEEMGTQREKLICILEVRNGDIYNRQTVEKIERITRKLMLIDEIIPGKIVSLATGMNHYESTVEGLMGAPILGRISPETEEDFLAVKRRVAVNPLGIGNYVSYDGTATLITAGITDLRTKAEAMYRQSSAEEKAGLSLKQYKKQAIERFHHDLLQLVAELKAEEEDANHTLYFTGDRLLAAQLAAMGRRQVPVAAAIMTALMLVLLAGYFRSLRGVLVPVFAFAFSVLWGLGLFSAGKLSLNAMAFLFPLLLGVLSLLCSVMVMSAYERGNDNAGTKAQAIVAAYRRVPVAASVLTAGLVSAALAVAGVPMIRELGWFGLLWALGTFVVVVLICPVVLSLLPRPAPEVKGRNGRGFEALAGRLTKISRGGGKAGLAFLLILILVAGLVCAWRLDVGDNVPGSSYVRTTNPWNRGFHVMAGKFNGPYLLAVYVEAKEKGGLLDPEAINQMGDFSTYLTCGGRVRQSVAFDYIVKLGRIALMDGNPRWWTVPASKKDVEGLARLLTFPGGLEVLVDKTFSRATIPAFFADEEDARIDEDLSAMQAYIDGHPSVYMDFHLGGGLLAETKAINDGTRDAYRKALAVALVALFLAGLLVVRSVSRSLIVTLSVAAGQALVLVIMTILGRSVSVAAVPAAVAGVAFGAVLGMYLVRRAVSGGREIAGSVDVLEKGWRKAGGGVLFLGVLAFGSMAPWFCIGMKIPADMALVLGITVLLQSVVAVVFIPALTAAFQEK